MTDQKKYQPPMKLDINTHEALERFIGTNPDEVEYLGDIPRATHSGEQQISGITIPVYNLDSGQRVISERGFLAIIGVKSRAKSNGPRITRLLSDKLVKPFFSKELLMDLGSPIEFLNAKNLTTFGYEVSILNKFCIGFSKAKSAKALKTETQERYAANCEQLLYAFSDVGIKAWVDEATGYQRDRARDALNKILEKYIADDASKWTKTFPDEYYMEIFRLKGWDYNAETIKNKPGVVGTYTNDIVYSRLAPGVLDALREKNPVVTDNGARKRKHHQWLTKDSGHPELKSHLGNIVFMMKGNTSWDAFYRQLVRAAPKLNDQFSFDLDD